MALVYFNEDKTAFAFACAVGRFGNKYSGTCEITQGYWVRHRGLTTVRGPFARKVVRPLFVLERGSGQTTVSRHNLFSACLNRLPILHTARPCILLIKGVFIIPTFLNYYPLALKLSTTLAYITLWLMRGAL